MAERKVEKPGKCPWCRRLPCTVKRTWHDNRWYVGHCCDAVAACGACGPNRSTEREAIRAWNRIALAAGKKVKRG